jgi:hypothetical protein
MYDLDVTLGRRAELTITRNAPPQPRPPNVSDPAVHPLHEYLGWIYLRTHPAAVGPSDDLDDGKATPVGDTGDYADLVRVKLKGHLVSDAHLLAAGDGPRRIILSHPITVGEASYGGHPPP